MIVVAFVSGALVFCIGVLVGAAMVQNTISKVLNQNVD